MKLIKMRTLSAGPDGVMAPGQTYPVDDKTAAALVKAGAAEYIDPPALEQATAPELPEKAVKPNPKKKPAARKKKAK